MLQLRTDEGTDPGWRLEVADGWIGKTRGLMGRRSLAAGEGLYLPGTNSIHMMFMRFPIDCLFVGALRSDGSREVVGVRERLAPWRGVVWWVRGARGAVELPAGSLAAAGLRRGDVVRLEPASVVRVEVVSRAGGSSDPERYSVRQQPHAQQDQPGGERGSLAV